MSDIPDPSPIPLPQTPYWPYLQSASVLSSFAAESLRPVGGGPLNLVTTAEMLVDHGEAITLGPAQGQWRIADDTRRRVLRHLAARDRLGAALSANPARAGDPPQRALEELLSRTPVQLTGRSLADLIGLERALDWCDAIPGLLLPDRVDVQACVARERLLEPMRRLTEGGFAGRADQLRDLRSYVDELPPQNWREVAQRYRQRFVELFTHLPPLVVHGPGGVGKSTLIARFILEHTDAARTSSLPFIYLDLDRSTLSLDNPDTLLEEALRQIRVQAPELTEQAERLAGDAAGRRAVEEAGNIAVSAQFTREGQVRTSLAELLNRLADLRQRNILLVIDTFEVAQRRGTTVALNLLTFAAEQLAQVPRLRVVIAGRARLRQKEDFGFAATRPTWRDLPLEGFDGPAAEAYLRAQLKRFGINDPAPEDLQKVVSLAGGKQPAGGNPLSLRLAAQVFARDGIAGLTDAVTRRALKGKVEAEQIQGMLHARIVEQLPERLRKIASPGLIVRRITEAVIARVLAGPCGLEITSEEEPRQFMAELRDEVALVESTPEGALRHRPDVRLIMLPLLRHENRPLAREIDEAAVDYWSKESGGIARAEEIYHRLWLRQSRAELEGRWDPEAGQSRAELEARWDPEARDALQDALDEFDALDADPLLRIWLYEKLGRDLPAALRAQAGLRSWELDTEQKVRSLLGSGSAESALNVLGERTERSPLSPLWLLEIDALQLLGRDAQASNVAERALTEAADSDAPAHVHALLLRRATLDERAGRLDAALAAAKQASAEAATARDPVLQLAAGVACCRLLRKQLAQAERVEAASPAGAAELSESRPGELKSALTKLKSDLCRLLEDRGLQNLLGPQPALLRQTAAELGEEYGSLLLRALAELGLEPAEIDQLKESLHRLGPEVGSAITSLLVTQEDPGPKGGTAQVGRLLASTLSGVIDRADVRAAVTDVLRRSVDRLINQVLI